MNEYSEFYYSEFISLINGISKRKKDSPQKKYLYINIWNITCKPCIDEMKFLEILPDQIHKEFEYVYISLHSNEAVKRKLGNYELGSKFIFLNNMTDFITVVREELELDYLYFPIHLITKWNGEILAYRLGSIESSQDIDLIINFANSLN